METFNVRKRNIFLIATSIIKLSLATAVGQAIQALQESNFAAIWKWPRTTLQTPVAKYLKILWLVKLSLRQFVVLQW